MQRILDFIKVKFKVYPIQSAVLLMTLIIVGVWIGRNLFGFVPEQQAILTPGEKALTELDDSDPAKPYLEGLVDSGVFESYEDFQDTSQLTANSDIYGLYAQLPVKIRGFQIYRRSDKVVVEYIDVYNHQDAIEYLKTYSILSDNPILKFVQVNKLTKLN